MAEKSIDLPQECWELIFNFIDHHRHFESLSLVSTRFLSITNHLRRTLTIPSHASSSLPSLLRRFPNLKEIEFHENLDSLLSQISQSGLDLESVTLSNQIFPSMGLRELGLKMINLRKLNCSRTLYLQDSDLFVIGNSFPLLEDLDISYPQYNSRFNPNGSLDLMSFSGVVSDEGILHLSMKLKRLVKINISGSQFITDKSLLCLSSNCMSLSKVVIRDCDFITQNGIGQVMRRSGSLNYISLDGIGIPSIDVFFKESFGYAKALCELALSNSFISDEFLYSIADACPPLKKVTLSNCYNFSAVGIFVLLYKYQHLEYLDLEGANFLTDESMMELSRVLCKLTYINLGFCSKLTSRTFFTLIRSCLLLKEMKMERTNLGLEEFKMDFVINPHIKSLKLEGNENLSDDCVNKIAQCCPSLQMLNISNCPNVTEEGIREILRICCEIRHLVINRCLGIKIRDINFELPKLEVLQAKGPTIDDEALTIIAKRCPGLLELDLEGCLNVTAPAVQEVVRSCRKLREINLKWCDSVEPDIITWMAVSGPSLRKICSPNGFVPTDKQASFFLRHGCLVYKGREDVDGRSDLNGGKRATVNTSAVIPDEIFPLNDMRFFGFRFSC